MQVARFENGGFVIHKIPNGAGRASAWFDEQGNLLDIEAFNRNGRPCKSSKALRQRAEGLGRIYATELKI